MLPPLYSFTLPPAYRWAPQPLLTDLAGIMRRVVRVPQLPPGSFAASPQGECTVGISFLQVGICPYCSLLLCTALTALPVPL